MATNFSDLKRSRNNDLAKLTQEMNKVQSGGEKKSFKDDRFWNPTVDKAGNGYAVIRFLPPAEGEDVPWVQTWSHGFQGPTGKWYIENSRTTLNDKDPVSEYNSLLWNSGVESDKEIARLQKRRLAYTANVLVVKDASNPENEGQVRLYKFGKKIFDKINDLMHPAFEDETPVNPFDLWAGADFKLKIRKVEGYRNYDKSEFDSPAALSEDDDELERIWKTEYSLQEFIAPENFKSYDELKAHMNSVLQLDTGETAAPAPAQTAAYVAPTVQRPAPKVAEPETAESSSYDTDEDDDDELSAFEKLAEG
jgi:hypothetical protein